MLLAASLTTTACGGEDSNTTSATAPAADAGSFIIDDDALPAGGSRELIVSEQSTSKTSVVQCFCDSLYRNTLLFYHFPDYNAVLVVEFDNSLSSFPASGIVHLFSMSAGREEIAQWINNQHSDGLFINPAEPVSSFDIPSTDIAVTSSAFAESIEGFNGDKYEKYQVEFTVNNVLESDRFFLNGFSDQTNVFLQIQPPSFIE